MTDRPARTAASGTAGGGAQPGWFDALYRQSYRQLVLIVFGVVGSLGDAEECVQEAFVRGYARRRSLAAVENREAWLTTVALNVARRKLRRGAHLRRVVETSSAARAVGVAPDVMTSGPGETVEQRLDLLDALNALAPDLRQVVAMFHLADLPLQEIALRLELPIGTVKSRLSRGRAALAAQLGSTSGDEATGDHARRQEGPR